MESRSKRDRPKEKRLTQTLSVSSPDLLRQVFIAAAKEERKKKVSAPWLDRQGSPFCDLETPNGVQDPASVRHIHAARCLAIWLIDDHGHLDTERLATADAEIRRTAFPLGPDGDLDACRHKHMLRVLNWLKDKGLRAAFHRITKPIGNAIADELIRDSLWLPGQVIIDDAQTRRAVLSAWLTYLRQNVGSCFATAPAILVMGEQPALFLQDMNDLLATGQLTRVIDGYEHSVPLSSSWGAGDLKKIVPISADSALWSSSAFLSACQSAGVFSHALGEEKRPERIRQCALAAIPALANSPHPLMISPEVILKRILLDQHGLTEEEERLFEKKSRSITPASLAHPLYQSEMRKKGGIKSYTQYVIQFEKAKSAFKACADNALLKAWEFTVASFAESKSDFVSWNLYASLGLASAEPGGIGGKIRQYIEIKLEHYNKIVQECQERYEQYYYHVKHLEGRLRTAHSSEIEWLRAEYQNRLKELDGCVAQRDEAHEKAGRLSRGLVDIVAAYESLFKAYFQEIYDADMHDTSQSSYDDSPAGFRLLYKHGRRQPSSWTMVRNEDEFSTALADFFVATEREIADRPELEDLAADFSQMVTELVLQVKSQDFLESACIRVAKAYGLPAPQDPLSQLDRLERKPWSYISGGTMAGLVRSYYARLQPPTDKSSWVETPEELLAFFLNSIKQLPTSAKQLLLENPDRGILAYSPTHAFVVTPGAPLFREGWQDEAYTYTWIRDRYILPRKNFWSSILLDKQAIDKIIAALSFVLPPPYNARLSHCLAQIPPGLSPAEFREAALRAVAADLSLTPIRHAVVNPDALDSLLFEMLPFTPGRRLKVIIEEVWTSFKWTKAKKAKAAQVFDTLYGKTDVGELFSAKQVVDIAKSVVILTEESWAVSYDALSQIRSALEDTGAVQPAPLAFADTNWLQDLFAFVVNPGTEQLELWCLYHSMTRGKPMSEWDKWVDGSHREAWGVYPFAYEYSK